MKKQPVRFGFFLATLAACILVFVWLVFAIITWNFSVSPFELRMLLVFSVLAGVVGYVSEKWFI
jgi:hypothetical protein